MFRLGISSFVLIGTGYLCHCQSPILPNLEGDVLKSVLVIEYKPGFVELYKEAREILYSEIYNDHDTVMTLYSGHSKYLPSGHSSPIQFLAMGGNADGISTEHIYPRSKGASEENGNAFSDLHNLAPARWEVNEARANFPFDEIEDTDTDLWFYKNSKLTSETNIPENEKDRYSEVDIIDSFIEGFFEPRESVKGDVARSVFYFYTMYEEEALRADPDYFANMKEVLCQWHNSDGIDSLEMARNLMKARYQENKPNPFILDCSLVNRIYCPEINAECSDLTTSLNEELQLDATFQPEVKILPNPNRGVFTLDISNTPPGPYRMDIFNREGRRILRVEDRLDYFNTFHLRTNNTGTYFLHIINLDTGRKFSGAFQIIN